MKYIISFFIILFFSACSTKVYEKTESKVITIKTKQLRYSDLGYVRSGLDGVELELFTVGKSLFKVEIGNSVCTNEGCMSKKSFNKEFLNEHYPENMLQNVILGKAIYKAINLQKNKFGFSQKITTEAVDISYIVGDGEIYFKDKKNKILIKIRDN